MQKQIAVMYRLQQIIFLLKNKENKKQSMSQLLEKSQQVLDQLNLFMESEKMLFEEAQQCFLENDRKIDTVKADMIRAQKREDDLYATNHRKSEFIKGSILKEKELGEKRLKRFEDDKNLLKAENERLQNQLDQQQRQKDKFEENMALIKKEIEAQTILINAQNDLNQQKYQQLLDALKEIDNKAFDHFSVTVKSRNPVVIAGIDGEFGEYSCANCNIHLTIPIGELINHDRLHHCRECGSALVFLAHVIKQHVPQTEDESTYHCSQCDQELEQSFLAEKVSTEITDTTCPNCERLLINL
jgi:predicted  nucleic acid-binding Zn-ribbon protein